MPKKYSRKLKKTKKNKSNKNIKKINKSKKTIKNRIIKIRGGMKRGQSLGSLSNNEETRQRREKKTIPEYDTLYGIIKSRNSNVSIKVALTITPPNNNQGILPYSSEECVAPTLSACAILALNKFEQQNIARILNEDERKFLAALIFGIKGICDLYQGYLITLACIMNAVKITEIGEPNTRTDAPIIPVRKNITPQSSVWLFSQLRDTGDTETDVNVGARQFSENATGHLFFNINTILFIMFSKILWLYGTSAIRDPYKEFFNRLIRMIESQSINGGFLREIRQEDISALINGLDLTNLLNVQYLNLKELILFVDNRDDFVILTMNMSLEQLYQAALNLYSLYLTPDINIEQAQEQRIIELIEDAQRRGQIRNRDNYLPFFTEVPHIGDLIYENLRLSHLNVAAILFHCISVPVQKAICEFYLIQKTLSTSTDSHDTRDAGRVPVNCQPLMESMRTCQLIASNGNTGISDNMYPVLAFTRIEGIQENGGIREKKSYFCSIGRPLKREVHVRYNTESSAFQNYLQGFFPNKPQDTDNKSYHYLHLNEYALFYLNSCLITPMAEQLHLRRQIPGYTIDNQGTTKFFSNDSFCSVQPGTIIDPITFRVTLNNGVSIVMICTPFEVNCQVPISVHPELTVYTNKKNKKVVYFDNEGNVYVIDRITGDTLKTLFDIFFNGKKPLDPTFNGMFNQFFPPPAPHVFNATLYMLPDSLQIICSDMLNWIILYNNEQLRIGGPTLFDMFQLFGLYCDTRLIEYTPQSASAAFILLIHSYEIRDNVSYTKSISAESLRLQHQFQLDKRRAADAAVAAVQALAAAQPTPINES